MCIKKQTILTIICSTCTIVLVGAIFIQTTFLNSYKELETPDIQADTKRLLDTLDRELDNLSAITNDRAARDDTYRFVQDKNQEYVESNLVDGTFESLNVNIIIYYNLDGKVICQKAYDPENQEEIQLPIPILDYFENNPDFFINEEADKAMYAAKEAGRNCIRVFQSL